MPLRTTRDETGKFVTTYHCDQCEMLSINGIPCHEIGCSEAWRDTKISCRWCEAEFSPEFHRQQFCSDCCQESFQS